MSTKPVEDGGRGPTELSGMVDLTRDANGRTRARLLDLVPGRSGETYRAWLKERGEAFKAGVEIATLDPFHGYKNAIDDRLQDAVSVLDAFHVVKLATRSSTTCAGGCSRTRPATSRQQGRRGDPLYRIRNILRAGEQNLTDQQQARLGTAFTAREEHLEVELAWRCAQQVRSCYHQDTRRRPRGRREGPGLVQQLPDPRGRPPRAHAEAVEPGVPPPQARATPMTPHSTAKGRYSCRRPGGALAGAGETG